MASLWNYGKKTSGSKKPNTTDESIQRKRPIREDPLFDLEDDDERRYEPDMTEERRSRRSAPATPEREARARRISPDPRSESGDFRRTRSEASRSSSLPREASDEESIFSGRHSAPDRRSEAPSSIPRSETVRPETPSPAPRMARPEPPVVSSHETPSPAPASEMSPVRPTSGPMGYITPKDESDFKALIEKLEQIDCANGSGTFTDDNGRQHSINPLCISRKMFEMMRIVVYHYDRPEPPLRKVEPFWFPCKDEHNVKWDSPIGLREDVEYLMWMGAKTTDYNTNGRMCVFIVIDKDGNPVVETTDKGEKNWAGATAREIAAWRAKHPDIA